MKDTPVIRGPDNYICHKLMRKYYTCGNGLHEIEEWEPGCWAVVEMPDNEDYDFLRQTLRIPPSFIEYVADNDEQPHIEREDGWIMTIIRIPVECSTPSLPYQTVPLGIISGPAGMVTLSYHENMIVSGLIAREARKPLAIRNGSDLVLRLINSSAAWYLICLRNLNSEFDSSMQQLRRSVRNEDLISMMDLQKSLVYFTTSLQGNLVMLGRLKNIYGPDIDEDLVEDVEIEVKQAMETASVYSDIFSGAMDTFASIISNNVNLVMKRMTSLSIALAIPTLVASFYGMNVQISLSSNPYGFWIIVFASGMLTALAVVWFRIIKWF